MILFIYQLSILSHVDFTSTKSDDVDLHLKQLCLSPHLVCESVVEVTSVVCPGESF